MKKCFNTNFHIHELSFKLVENFKKKTLINALKNKIKFGVKTIFDSYPIETNIFNCENIAY